MISPGATDVFSTHSRGLSRLQNLGPLGLGRVKLAIGPWLPRGTSHLLAWGRKPSGERTKALADKSGIPIFYIEDGFLRSVGLGHSEEPFSIVLDDLGVYYDATAPSRLEHLIAGEKSSEEIRRAHCIAESWRELRLSKYNHAREFRGGLPENFVLAVDQTAGDASLRYGMADETSFEKMMQAALDWDPDCTVLLKTHPDVVAGRKQSCVDSEKWALHPRVKIFAEDCHPPSLIQKASAVFVVTSQMGFEGLLWGKPVHVFGMPFYAGWGLTLDETPAPARRGSATLPQLIHAAMVEYAGYLHPETRQRCEVEDLMEWMGLQRRMRERFASQIAVPIFPLANRATLRKFFAGSTLEFGRAKSLEYRTVAIWGQVAPPAEVPLGAKILRVEDGFLRSVGLGAGLVQPLSWVIDGTGMYYDATHSSDLENLLSNSAFDHELVQRAEALIQRIVQNGLTKYNVGSAGQLDLPTDRPILLVPGQVEDDQSILLGSPAIRGNFALLQKVRAERPEAFVIYKPHPDVVAGYRRQGRSEPAAASECDLVISDYSMGELLAKVDEVHTMTSLSGFEALLRGKKVKAYGMPFYAGWGLTEDYLKCARRARRLSLAELVAATLILYPTYVSRETGHFTSPERALDEMVVWRAKSSGNVAAVRRTVSFLKGCAEAFLPDWKHKTPNLLK